MDSDYGLRPGSRVRLLKTTSGVRLGMDVLLPIPKQAKGPSMDQVSGFPHISLISVSIFVTYQFGPSGQQHLRECLGKC